MSKDFIKADLTDPRTCDAHIRDFDVVYHLADIVAGVDFVFANQPFVYRNVRAILKNLCFNNLNAIPKMHVL